LAPLLLFWHAQQQQQQTHGFSAVWAKEEEEGGVGFVFCGVVVKRFASDYCRFVLVIIILPVYKM
jgi:hypothetical protein